MKRLKRLFFAIFLLAAAGIGASFWVRSQVELSVGSLVYADSARLPANQAGLVLGAQVVDNKVPSVALANRLQVAAELYQEGKVKELVLSGDGRSPDYDEVAVMRAYLLELKVPEKALLLDRQGLRTYDSCDRAKNVYHLDRLTVITQKDHLLRAVYTCSRLGIETVGMEAPDFEKPGTFDDAAYWEYRVREQGALLLAWLETHVGINQPVSTHD